MPADLAPHRIFTQTVFIANDSLYSSNLNGENMGDKLTALQKIRSIADYQFGKGVGEKLFPDEVKIIHSRRTGKIRHVYLGEEMLATLRPTNGLFSLTIAGAKRIVEGVKTRRLWVKVGEEAEPFVVRGKSVFAKHVIDADEEIRPQEEVIVINEDNKVLAVGRALLTGKEMKAFERGVAVRVRRGAAEEVKKETPRV
jgi:predicted RNA-binding protein (TIGR00451 family)